jgi:AcrR family transcriptional regulator
MDDLTVEMVDERTDDLAVLPGSRSPLGPDRVVPRGRHGHSREEIQRVHRARLLDAFVDVVGEAGYENTKIVDVCKRAGVSNRAFYATFTDKEDCYLAAFDCGTRYIVEKVTQAYESAPGPWPARVHAGIETAMAYLAANPAFARFCTLEPPRVGPVAVERLNAVIEDLRHKFEADQRAIAAPALRDGPREAVLVGAMVRPIFGYIEDGKTERLPDLSSSLVDFLALAVLGAEPADSSLEPA